MNDSMPRNGGRNTRDHTDEAEALFRRFASRHDMEISTTNEAHAELLMTVPKHGRFATDIVLGLQNGDELNIGIGAFWSSFFPFTDVQQTGERILDGLALGDCRIAVHRQLGRVIRRELEMREGSRWTGSYVQHTGITIPMIGVRVEHVDL